MLLYSYTEQAVNISNELVLHYKNKVMNNKYKGIFILSCGLSIVALIISVIALCRTCPRTVSLSFDYLGVIIGILSVLVTVVIGWNIYSILDIKNLRSENDGKIKKLEEKFYNNAYTGLAQTHLSFANSYVIDLSEKDSSKSKNQRVGLFILHYLYTISYYCETKQYKNGDIKDNIKTWIGTIIKITNREKECNADFKLSVSYYNQLVKLCDQISDKMPSNELFEELTEKIKSIPIDQKQK